MGKIIIPLIILKAYPSIFQGIYADITVFWGSHDDVMVQLH